MKSIFLHTANDFYPQGTPVKCCFEGNTTRGTLWDEDANRNLIAYKTTDGKIRWSHCSFVTLDKYRLTLP